MDLPNLTDDNWVENLKAYGEYRKEMWDNEEKPCGVWRWYYDEEKTKMKAEMVFDDNYPTYMTCWYKNGLVKAEGRYKDGAPREPWEFCAGRDPLVTGYAAFVVTYLITTILNWVW